MHLGKFHQAIYLLASEFSENKINEKFAQIIASLNAVSANPNNPDISKQFKVALDDIRSTLIQSELNSPRPVLAEIIRSISADRYIGEKLFLRLKKAIEANQLAPAAAAQDLQTIQIEVETFFKHISSINTAFSALEVEYDEIEDGKAEIGLLIPTDGERSTLKDLSKEVNQWHIALSAIAEVFDENNTPISMKIFSTTDWMFYLYTTPATLFGISLSLKGINQILADLILSKKLIKELAGTGTSEKLIDDLEKEHDGKLDVQFRKLAEKIIDEHYKGNDVGRKNELKNSVTQGVKTLAKKVATGSKIELKLKAPPRPPKGVGNEQTEEQQKLMNEIEQLEKLAEDIDNDAKAIIFNDEIGEDMALLDYPEEHEKNQD